MINTFKQLKIIISNLLLPKPALQSNTVFLLLQVVLASSVLVVVKVSPLLLTDKHGVGVTVVSHDSENRMLVDGYDPAGSYVHNISYLSGSITSVQQVAKLTDISAHCEPGYQVRMPWLTAPQWSRQHGLYAWLVGITWRQGDDLSGSGQFYSLHVRMRVKWIMRRSSLWTSLWHKWLCLAGGQRTAYK